MTKGTHLLADLKGLPPPLSSDPLPWIHAFLTAASRLDLTVIDHKSHIFSPPRRPGHTAFVLIDSSHFAVHSYADDQIAAVDLFVCRDLDLQAVFGDLVAELGISHQSISRLQIIDRF